jgi:hypothetical protein
VCMVVFMDDSYMLMEMRHNGCETCMDEIFVCMDVRVEWMRFLCV